MCHLNLSKVLIEVVCVWRVHRDECMCVRMSVCVCIVWAMISAGAPAQIWAGRSAALRSRACKPSDLFVAHPFSQPSHPSLRKTWRPPLSPLAPSITCCRPSSVCLASDARRRSSPPPPPPLAVVNHKKSPVADFRSPSLHP